MDHTPARTTTRRIPRILAVGLPVAIAAIAVASDVDGRKAQELRIGGDRAPEILEPPPADGPQVLIPPTELPGGHAPGRLLGGHRRAVGEADGLVPDGVSVFDDETPAVANLDPSLLNALRRAATDAAKNGVEFQVNSGWRSPAYQEQLLREAISEYGSKEEAARWVATPSTSAHVSGDAVDIGPVDATIWLSKHGARYGLCQIYRSEPWHYELRPEATSRDCPRMYADPSHDPRMQR